MLVFIFELMLDSKNKFETISRANYTILKTNQNQLYEDISNDLQEICS